RHGMPAVKDGRIAIGPQAFALRPLEALAALRLFAGRTGLARMGGTAGHGSVPVALQLAGAVVYRNRCSPASWLRSIDFAPACHHKPPIRPVSTNPFVLADQCCAPARGSVQSGKWGGL